MFSFFKKPSEGAVGWLIVGLGNPGLKYERSRHNVGFITLDYLAKEAGVSVNRSRFKALVGEATVSGQRVLLMKPQTFMNNSGEAVGEALRWYKLPPERLIVFSDDVSLEPGRVRVKANSSAGGHNGLKSIIYHANSEAFPRVKIGVGAPPNPEYPMPDWVLGSFNEADGRAVTDAIKRAAAAAEVIIAKDVASAANLYNSTVYTPK